MKKILLTALAIILCVTLPACTPAQTDQPDSGSASPTAAPAASPAVSGSSVTPDPSPAVRQVLVVIPNQDFNPTEFSAVTEALDSHGIPFLIAAPQAGAAVSMGSSISVNADRSFDQITAGEYIGVVFIGGTGTQALWEEEILQALSREIYESGGIAAAICLAPVILARAGLLDDITATGYESSDTRTEYEKTSAHMDYAQPVVVDAEGRIITGNGPGAAREFAEAVAGALLSLDD